MDMDIHMTHTNDQNSENSQDGITSKDGVCWTTTIETRVLGLVRGPTGRGDVPEEGCGLMAGGGQGPEGRHGGQERLPVRQTQLAPRCHRWSQNLLESLSPPLRRLSTDYFGRTGRRDNFGGGEVTTSGEKGPTDTAGQIIGWLVGTLPLTAS